MDRISAALYSPLGGHVGALGVRVLNTRVGIPVAAVAGPCVWDGIDSDELNNSSLLVINTRKCPLPVPGRPYVMLTNGAGCFHFARVFVKTLLGLTELLLGVGAFRNPGEW